jgi:hypothetical protein
MRCSEPQAAVRLKKGLDLVSSEYALATAQDAMRIWISAGYFRTERQERAPRSLDFARDQIVGHKRFLIIRVVSRMWRRALSAAVASG